MAGRGFAPKDPDRRARRNKDPIGSTVLVFTPGEQPFLPADVDWHPQTIEWWSMWRETAQANTFTATDWSFLLDTALIHTKFWTGDMRAAGELRLRVAKFGATPEDRARLRMVFADADEKDAKRSGASSQPGARTPYGNLRAVNSDES